MRDDTASAQVGFWVKAAVQIACKQPSEEVRVELV
jgi:hypothetical protein